MKKIYNILTVTGNSEINIKLKKYKNINIINNDIIYQDAIFEIMELNNNIDFIIYSEEILGQLNILELSEKIYEINNNTKIILILKKNNEFEEEYINKDNIVKILYKNKMITENLRDFFISNKIIDENNIEKNINENNNIEKNIDEDNNIIKNNTNNIMEKKLNNIKNNNIKNNIIKNDKIFNKKNNIIKYNKIISEKNNIMKYKNNINNLVDEIINVNVLIKKIIKIKKEKNSNNLINNKIISILGTSGSGKSIFSILLANGLKKYSKKILIIDFDILNNSLHTILGVKKCSPQNKNIIKNNINNIMEIADIIVNINNKIDLISGANLIFNSGKKIDKNELGYIIKKISSKYDAVIIDTSSECFYDYTKEILNLSDKAIFMTEGNLLDLAKSKRLLEIYRNDWKIENSKINIIFNKFNNRCIDIKILNSLYSDYVILGCIKLKIDIIEMINCNFKKIMYKNNYLKKYEEIANKMIV